MWALYITCKYLMWWIAASQRAKTSTICEARFEGHCQRNCSSCICKLLGFQWKKSMIGQYSVVPAVLGIIHHTASIWIFGFLPCGLEKRSSIEYFIVSLSRCFHIFLEKKYQEIIGVFLCITLCFLYQEARGDRIPPAADMPHWTLVLVFFFT